MEDNLNFELDLLNRIITLLLALSGLAERASERSLMACSFMMWILRPAETAVSAYADLPPDMMPAPFARSGNAREDATCLAKRFRMLAHLMIREAEQMLRFASGQGPRKHGSKAASPRFHRILGPAYSLVRWAKQKCHDTS